MSNDDFEAYNNALGEPRKSKRDIGRCLCERHDRKDRWHRRTKWSISEDKIMQGTVSTSRHRTKRGKR